MKALYQESIITSFRSRQGYFQSLSHLRERKPHPETLLRPDANWPHHTLLYVTLLTKVWLSKVCAPFPDPTLISRVRGKPVWLNCVILFIFHFYSSLVTCANVDLYKFLEPCILSFVFTVSTHTIELFLLTVPLSHEIYCLIFSFGGRRWVDSRASLMPAMSCVTDQQPQP